jgi:hypothetical protein
MYVVYVLYSQRFDKIYIGYTSDLIDMFKSKILQFILNLALTDNNENSN